MKTTDPGPSVFFECPICDDVAEHAILKGNLGKGNVTGTFRCTGCGRVFSGTIRIPVELTVKVVFSDGDVSEETATTLESDEIIEVGDEFILDDGRRVQVTHIDIESGANTKHAQADIIKKLWVKQFGILNVKVSVNDNRVTYPLVTEAEPDDEFVVGMVLQFEDFDAYIHAIKTTDRILKKGGAEARDIVRIYGRIRGKTYPVMDEDDPIDYDEE
ncbi:MAG: hypothetical protein LBT41_01385 [Candidatus Methanoplasma sp.]|jgi:uncharacterized Zn finger protein|nr:hypothetical protein [Candidatus Methanoplasma sp.]